MDRLPLAPGLAAALVLSALPAFAQGERPITGGNGTLVMGAYSGHVLAVDEATERVDKIPLKTGYPFIMRASRGDSRLYALSGDLEHFEVVDAATRSSIDTFTLSEPGKRSRVAGYAVDAPRQIIAINHLLVTKAIDHFELSESRLVLYDMKAHKVLRTLERPGGENDRVTNLRFSPDGKWLYSFDREVLIFDTSTLKLVDRWDMSQPSELGLGRGNLGSSEDNEDNTGAYDGLFTIEDPVEHRRILGIGRVNLAARTVDYFPLGPAEQNIRMNFALSPDKSKGYILAQAIGRYELWIVDMNERRVATKVPFQGRPRMAIKTSTNGKLLYIYEAGRTIDVYDASNFKFLHTITLDADMTYNSFQILSTSEHATTAGPQ